MLNKQFSYLAGTGRTATHFFSAVLGKHCDRSKVVTFHDGITDRLKKGNRFTALQCFTNHALNLMVKHPHKEHYVECNPAFLEYIALWYGVKQAAFVLPDAWMAQPARSLLIVRHPFGYVRSLLAKGWGWNWWKLPFADTVYGKHNWQNVNALDGLAKAWLVKNQFFYSLANTENCQLVQYEWLFGDGVSKADFAKRFRGLTEFLGLDILITDNALGDLQRTRFAIKAGPKAHDLTTKQRDIVAAICKPLMENLGYE
ncbi:MAG: hypothetical protein GWN93_17265 [Deltaproteobacteria bacterium]|nr:hypothetical protein [Deltaproteobacteria bacterium]